MNKKLLWIWLIVFIFSVWFLFFRDIKENFFPMGILFLIYISSLFFMNSYRNKDRLTKFLSSIEYIRKYYFPGFAIVTTLLLGLVFKTEQNLFGTIMLWYILLFIAIDLVIWIPSFNMLKDNINSIPGRIYFVVTTFVFGWLISNLTGRIAGGNWIVGLEEFIIDNSVFYFLSLGELIIGIVLIFYFFKPSFKLN